MIVDLQTLEAQIKLYLYNRKDLDAVIPFFIQLAEKKLFRELRCPKNEAEVTGDLSLDPTGFALPADFVEMKFLTVNGKPLERKSDIEYLTRINIDNAPGEPSWFARVLTNIKLWREADSDYSYSFVYWQTQEGNLVVPADTNAILLYAPDLYLYGSLIEAMPFLVKDDRLNTWQAMFQQAMDKVNSQTIEDEFAGSNVSVSSPYSDPIRGIQSGRRL